MPDHVANQKREKRGFDLLAKKIQGFYVPTSAEKESLLRILGISSRFRQTFDAIRLNVANYSEVKSAQDFDLIELKVTDECLPDLPHGFFFGLTDNEEMLLKVFEGKYFLCLVCLHEKTKDYRLLSWNDLQKLIQNKRIQYQINLRSKPKSSAATAS